MSKPTALEIEMCRHKPGCPRRHHDGACTCYVDADGDFHCFQCHLNYFISCPFHASTVTPQAAPKVNALPAVWDLVTEDIKQRDAFGFAKYRTRLQPFNGRDALVDLYQELLDAVVYTRQLLYERDNK